MNILDPSSRLIAVNDSFSNNRNFELGRPSGVAGVPGLRHLYPAVVVAVLLCLVGPLAFFTILVGGELP